MCFFCIFFKWNDYKINTFSKAKINYNLTFDYFTRINVHPCVLVSVFSKNKRRKHFPFYIIITCTMSQYFCQKNVFENYILCLNKAEKQ